MSQQRRIWLRHGGIIGILLLVLPTVQAAVVLNSSEYVGMNVSNSEVLRANATGLDLNGNKVTGFFSGAPDSGGGACGNNEVVQQINADGSYSCTTVSAGTDNQTLSEVLVQGNVANTSIDLGGNKIDDVAAINMNNALTDGNISNGISVTDAAGGSVDIGTLSDTGTLGFAWDISTETNLGTGDGVQLSGDNVAFDCSEVDGDSSIGCSGEDLQVNWGDASDLDSSGDISDFGDASELTSGGAISTFANASDLDASGSFSGTIDISSETNLGTDEGVQLSGDSIGFDCSAVDDTTLIGCDGEDIQVNEGSIDHGSISGLDDDDHSAYLDKDGDEAMTGSLDMGDHNIDSAGRLQVDNISLTGGVGTGGIDMGNEALTNLDSFNINDAGTDGAITWGGSQAEIYPAPLNDSNMDGYLQLVNDAGIAFEPGGDGTTAATFESSGTLDMHDNTITAPTGITSIAGKSPNDIGDDGDLYLDTDDRIEFRESGTTYMEIGDGASAGSIQIDASGNIVTTGSLTVGATECETNEYIGGDGNCKTDNTGTDDQSLKEVLVHGNKANQSIDMAENAIQNINTFQDGTGTNTITFDGSNNVNIPNGHLNVTGGDLNVTGQAIFGDRQAGASTQASVVVDDEVSAEDWYGTNSQIDVIPPDTSNYKGYYAATSGAELTGNNSADEVTGAYTYGMSADETTGNVSWMGGISAYAWHEGDGNVSNLYGGYFSPQPYNGGGVTNSYGVYVYNWDDGSVDLENEYGVFVADSDMSPSDDKYAVYTNGTTPSRFGGNVETAGNITASGEQFCIGYC